MKVTMTILRVYMRIWRLLACQGQLEGTPTEQVPRTEQRLPLHVGIEGTILSPKPSLSVVTFSQAVCLTTVWHCVDCWNARCLLVGALSPVNHRGLHQG